jgi:hypothetical protein
VPPQPVAQKDSHSARSPCSCGSAPVALNPALAGAWRNGEPPLASLCHNGNDADIHVSRAVSHRCCGGSVRMDPEPPHAFAGPRIRARPTARSVHQLARRLVNRTVASICFRYFVANENRRSPRVVLRPLRRHLGLDDPTAFAGRRIEIGCRPHSRPTRRFRSGRSAPRGRGEGVGTAVR